MKFFFTLWKYYKPAMKGRAWVVWSILLLYALGASLSRLYTPVIYKNIIDTIVTTNDPLSAKNTIFALIIHLVIVFVIFNILFRVADYLNSYFQSTTMRDLYNNAYTRIEKHSYNFFSNTFSGSLVAKTKRYISSFEVIFDRIFLEFTFTFVVVCGTITILFFQAPYVATVITVGVIFFITIIIYFNQKGQIFREKEAACDSRTIGLFSDILGNIITIKSFSAEQIEQSNVAKSTHLQHVARIRLWNFDNSRIAILGVIFMCMEVGGMFIAVKLWIDGSITAGTVVLIQIYFSNIFHNIWNLGRAIQKFNKALADSKEMIDIFETPCDINDPLYPAEFMCTKGSVTFSKVSFVYPNGVSVFDTFSLDIPPGQKIAIVGHSGAGKTTITKLLLRFYDVTNGSIQIDHQDIRTITQNDLRNVISYVPQESMLFHRSVKENIAYGNLNATEEEITVAAKKAKAHEFIEKLPDGYTTLVGERGIKLSGGERQRIAIARAILKNAPILVLDEATSSLDSISEIHIQQAFDELMKNKTVIVIAHRLSTIKKMDRILVLHDGKIVEDGSHDELLKINGWYRELWNHQSDGFIVE